MNAQDQLNSIEEKLTPEDIANIKYEKRFGYIISVVIIAITIVVNLGYITIPRLEADNETLIFIDILVLLAAVLIPFAVNRNYNYDLDLGTKFIRVGEVKIKEEVTSYQPGSAFYSIFRRMTSIQLKTIVIGNHRYDIEEELYNSLDVGDKVEIHLAPESETQLGIYKLDPARNPGILK